MNYIHKQLVEIGYKWCLKKCGFAFKELTTINDSGEIPDVIGFNSEGTFLLEAKISRGDFFSDKKKPFRIHSYQGMGDWRFYICPKGMIEVEELPPLWGLIEVDSNNKTRVVKNPFGKGNIYSRWNKVEKNERSEKQLLYSALRRIHLRGLMDVIYESQIIEVI